MKTQSFSELAIQGASTFHISSSDPLITRGGKFIAGRAVYATIALASVVEALAFAVLTAIVSPTYIWTSKHVSLLSEYALSAVNAAVESVKGFMGYAQPVTLFDPSQFNSKESLGENSVTFQEKVIELAKKFWANPRPTIEVIATFTVIGALYYYFSSSAAPPPLPRQPQCLWSEAPFFEYPTYPPSPEKILPIIPTPLIPPRGTMTAPFFNPNNHIR